MKVLNIEELYKADGKPYWAVTVPKKDGTAAQSPLLEWIRPTYNIGDELPFDVELMKPSGSQWYYKRRDTPTQGSSQVSRGIPPKTGKPSYGKSHEEQESIMRQSARRDAVEIYKHCVEAGVPFDRNQFEEYFGIMLRVGDPIVSEAVKLGGRTKDK